MADSFKAFSAALSAKLGKKPNEINSRSTGFGGLEEPGTIDLTGVEAPFTNGVTKPTTPRKLRQTLPLTPPSSSRRSSVMGPPSLKIPSSILPPTPSKIPEERSKRPFSETDTEAELDPPTPSYRAAKRFVRATAAALTPDTPPISPSAQLTGTNSTHTTLATTAASTTPMTRCRGRSNLNLTTKQTTNGSTKTQKHLSSFELKRLANEICHQVDWELVEDYVACNRPGAVYHKLVRDLIMKRAQELEVEEVTMAGDTDQSVGDANSDSDSSYGGSDD